VTVLGLVLVAAWWWPNRPVAGDVAMPSARFDSLSTDSYRAWESPLTGVFPTSREVDSDLALVATRSRGIRTYSAIEGNYDLPAMARAHHLKVWLGLWLGGDRASNAREMAAAIADAKKYPDVIDRVVVGNEVLLRRDLPLDELIADIDHVRHAIHEPVTYADVWNFFLANPAIVPHLDVVTIHILPYWEDHPTNIAGAMQHVQDVLAQMHARFPAARIAIGETGWPSRGRWRQDAAPGLVNEAIYLRRFVALAASEHIDYNFVEAFDQIWKYQNEGVVGASWGIWTAGRTPKFPLSGPVQEDADWFVPAGLSVICGLLLYGQVTWRFRPGVRAGLTLAVLAMALGGALGFAWNGTAPVLFDRAAMIAGIGNLAGQAALAALFLRHAARHLDRDGVPLGNRNGSQSTRSWRTLLRLRWPDAWRGAHAEDALFEDLFFLFLWTAALLQALLFYDPRYRDFPLPTFAVPLVVTLFRLAFRMMPRGDGGREEGVLGIILLGCAIGSAIQEGSLNRQSLVWNAAALVLAAPLLMRVSKGQREVS
jgi:exo-beta-1,3-glucanase (GH17 family)